MPSKPSSVNKSKHIFIINGSAASISANKILIDHIIESSPAITFDICPDLKTIPHFSPESSLDQTPVIVLQLRDSIQKADAVIICTPEYIFSIPAGLKNILEWCVATTIFSGKPVAIITASANGEKGHTALRLIMETLGAKLTAQTMLLIKGIKGKIDDHHIESHTQNSIEALMTTLIALLNPKPE